MRKAIEVRRVVIRADIDEEGRSRLAQPVVVFAALAAFLVPIVASLITTVLLLALVVLAVVLVVP